MNKVVLMGRLTKDVDLRMTTGSKPTAVARLTLAVDRRTKEKEADFINCVAWGSTAEFIDKYFGRGDRLAGSGRIQTGSYTNKDGQKVYTTDVVLEEVEFCESKKNSAQKASDGAENGFVAVPDDVSDTDLPW